jgi:hypothetical protein
MDFTVVDGYLLGEPTTKASAVAAVLADRSPLPAAAPFYRALEAVGERAADEALVALRLVLAGRTPTDGRVRRVRALSAVARAASRGDARALRAARKRDAAELGDLPQSDDPRALIAACRAAYAAELS